MTTFGLADTTVFPLIRTLTRFEITDTEIPERFARAAWSAFTDPQDETAGKLLTRFGAVDALNRLLSGKTVTDIKQMKTLAPDVEAPPGPNFFPQRKTETAEFKTATWTNHANSRTLLAALTGAITVEAELLIHDDPGWPAGVDDLGNRAPHALWSRGQRTHVTAATPAITLVGSRAATVFGEHAAKEAAIGLIARDITIVTGGSFGVEAVAVATAIENNAPVIAILARGIDLLFPRNEDNRLDRVLEHGAIMSESGCGTRPTMALMRARARLLAATSQATVVVEAGLRSSALDTAKAAFALRRPVGAIPGPPSPTQSGVEELIGNRGAAPVTTGAEISALLDPISRK